MKAIVGVFKSRSDAERGVAELGPLEIPKDRINILTPEATDKKIAAVPTVAGEQPGMGKAMGAVVGGAMGVAGGAADSLRRLLVSWSPAWVLCWVLESLQVHCWVLLGQWEAPRLVRHLKVRYSKDCRKRNYSFMKMHCGRGTPLLWLWPKTAMQTLFAALLSSLAPKPSIEREKCGGLAFAM